MKNQIHQIQLNRSRFCTLTPEAVVEIEPNGRYDETYRIRLDEMDTLTKLHDWIRHLADRLGYTPEVIGDFVTFIARLSDREHEHENDMVLDELFAGVGALHAVGLPTHMPRDVAGLAHTEYCRETPDGGLDLVVGHVRYQLSPERIADGPALGQTLLDLRMKCWFTDTIQCDLTNVVTARWLAKSRGWI